MRHQERESQPGNPGRGDSSTRHTGSLPGLGFELDHGRWFERVRRALTPEDRVQPVRASSPLRAGYRLGPYELIDQIGQGGMGTVWRARRCDGSFERTVAIKCIRHGLHAPEILQRFRTEQLLLARLEHNHIARLYDGGATSDGMPFIAMEYVAGAPIGQYCQDGNLTVEQRVRLFRHVCLAVQYAHNNLVLHRDLKPANILVDESGAPRLLDFGIAKLVEVDDQLTQTDARILTPRYASPEQIRGERLTTASDVYALGVILYELLAEESPYFGQLQSRTAIEQAVCRTVPLPPSERLRLSGKAARARQVRGDLDTIALAALQKEPSQRYASAAALAEDLLRYLEGSSIHARRVGPLGHAWRFVRRHRRTAALMATTAGVVVLATAGTLTWQFMSPRWAAERFRNAQLHFVTSDKCNTIWNASFFNSPVMAARDWGPGCDVPVATAALVEYDAALRWVDDPEIELERATVQLAVDISQADRLVSPPSALLNAAPLTCAFALEWQESDRVPDLPAARLDQAPVEDLRCLGLLSILCGDMRTALAAWSRLDAVASDPMVEALLGVLYLTLDQSELAFPRLLSAYRAYPHMGFLCIYLADAAVGCGDTAFAAQLLERAESLGGQDTMLGFQRVRMRYLLATGESDQAAELYAEYDLHTNAVAMLQYARHEFDAGRRRAGLGLLVYECGKPTNRHQVPARPMQAYFRMTQTWWSELAPAERWDVLMGAFDEDPADPGSLHEILRAYTWSTRRSELYREAILPEVSDVGAWSELSTPLHTELLRLYERLELADEARWQRLRKYSPLMRELQVLAWTSPGVASLSDLLAEWSVGE